jgi:hypothetical protein
MMVQLKSVLLSHTTDENAAGKRLPRWKGVMIARAVALVASTQEKQHPT